jgi:malate dehydrogenase
MLKAVIGGGGYPWPTGAYVDSPSLGFEKIMMALETTLDRSGVRWEVPRGTADEMAELRASYQHLVRLRDEVISLGVLPPLGAWSEVNPRL